MSRFSFILGRAPSVFHIRMGGCGGCSDAVDAVVRSAAAPALCECSSPRHAEVIVVSGCWTEDLSEAALKVISQAPATSRIVTAGDCALGRGFIVDRLKLEFTPPCPEPDLEIPGCPLEPAALLEGVRSVTG